MADRKGGSTWKGVHVVPLLIMVVRINMVVWVAEIAACTRLKSGVAHLLVASAKRKAVHDVNKQTIHQNTLATAIKTQIDQDNHRLNKQTIQNSDCLNHHDLHTHIGIDPSFV